MCSEQFDENNKSVQYIFDFGDVYSKYEIYYDSETGRWFKHEYHYGVIDIDEERDYGVSEVDKEYVIRHLVEEGDLRSLVRYYKELDVETRLPNLLEGMRRRADAHINGTGFLETRGYGYFLFQNGDYAICTYHGLYSISRWGSCNLDYSVINRIIKEKDTVLFYQYEHPEKEWICHPFWGERR